MDIIYRSGINPSLIERMFAQDPTKAERMKVYYQHLNQVRIEMIDNLKATQAQITVQKKGDSLSTKESPKSTFHTKKNNNKHCKKHSKSINLR